MATVTQTRTRSDNAVHFHGADVLGNGFVLPISASPTLDFFDSSSGTNVSAKGALIRFSLTSTSMLLRSATLTIDELAGSGSSAVWGLDIFTPRSASIDIDGDVWDFTPSGSDTGKAFISMVRTAVPVYEIDLSSIEHWRYIDTLDFGTIPVSTESHSIELDMGRLGAAIYSSDGAAGHGMVSELVLLLLVRVDNTSDTITSSSSTTVTLVTDEVSTNTTARRTGLSGPVDAQSRADECPRCGPMTLRETWVRDGAQSGQRGILLCPACRDDPEPLPVMLRSERPGINEEG